LFDPPAGAGTAGTERIAGFGFAEGGVVAGPQVLAVDVAGGQRLKGLGLGLADQGISLAQQRDHIGCPWLARGPPSDDDQLAPMMGIAEGMQTLVALAG